MELINMNGNCLESMRLYDIFSNSCPVYSVYSVLSEQQKGIEIPFPIRTVYMMGSESMRNDRLVIV
jgi:hypothetical protein